MQEKAFYKVQYLFIIIILSKKVIEEIYVKIIQTIYDTHHT